MQFKHKRFSFAIGVLTLSAAGVAGAYQAGGGAALAAGQPTVVVTVNLASVLEKLDQRASLDSSIRTLTDGLKAENEKRNAEITKAQTDITALQTELKAATDSDQRATIEKKLAEIQENAALTHLQNQAWVRFNENSMDVEASLAYQELYRNIKTAVGQMASASKYDIVFVDDSKGELTTNSESRVSREAQILQQIAQRRMLYVNPTIDITDELIVRMNNAFKSTAAPAVKPGS